MDSNSTDGMMMKCPKCGGDMKEDPANVGTMVCEKCGHTMKTGGEEMTPGL